MPARLTGDLVVGLNVEVGRGAAAFGADDWDTEFRPIIAWTSGRFTLALNPMFGWALTGPDRDREPDFEPAVKARVDTSLGFAAGLEYYAGMGRLSSLPALEQQQHVLYLALDLLDRAFDVNLGLGRGLTAAADEWTVKAIVGVAF